MLKKGVYSGREGYILGGSPYLLKRGIFRDGEVDCGRVARVRN